MHCTLSKAKRISYVEIKNKHLYWLELVVLVVVVRGWTEGRGERGGGVQEVVNLKQEKQLQNVVCNVLFT